MNFLMDGTHFSQTRPQLFCSRYKCKTKSLCYRYFILVDIIDLVVPMPGKIQTEDNNIICHCVIQTVLVRAVGTCYE